MEQLAFEGMPDRLYAATPARLTTYADCPRRYRHAYLDRPTPQRRGAMAHTSVGAAMHLALARWWELPRGRRTPEAGGDLLAGCWPADGFRDEGQRAASLHRSRRQVEDYLTGIDPDDVPVLVERTVSLQTATAWLWGRVDRVDDRAGDGLVVVDYKTGRHVPTVEEVAASVALAVYAEAVTSMLRRPCRRVELHHLPTRSVAAWQHTDASLAQHLQQTDTLAAELSVLDEQHADGTRAADVAFPARVGSRCGWCEFRPACAPGRSVTQQPAWAGVPG